MVACDVHDNLASQAAELSLLLRDMCAGSDEHAAASPAASPAASLGLTFYAVCDDEPDAPKQGLCARQRRGGGEGGGGESCGGGEGGEGGEGGRRPRRAAAATAAAKRKRLRGVLWHPDAGLLASTAAWRRRLGELARADAVSCNVGRANDFGPSCTTPSSSGAQGRLSLPGTAPMRAPGRSRLLQAGG